MANTNKHVKVHNNITVWIVLILLLLIIVPLMLMKILSSPADSTAKLTYQPDMGNRQANLSNGGMAVEAGDKVYYSDPTAGGQIYRTKAGATGGEAVQGAVGSSLNADKEYLYYIDGQTGRPMKLPLAGGEAAVIADRKVTKLMLADEYLYYIDLDGGSTLNRMHKSGEKEPDLLGNARLMQYAFASGRIFYHDLNSSGASYYMMPNGASPVELPVSMEQTIFTDGSRLFYTEGSRDGAISYIELGKDGQLYGPYTMETGVALCAVADGEYLYYVRAEDGCMYRQSIQGEAGAVKMTDIPVYGLQVIGEYIYYNSLLDKGSVGCVKKDAVAAGWA